MLQTSSFWLQRWHRKILTRTGCHFPAWHGDGDDKVGDASGKHGLDCSSRAAFIDLSKSREPANPPGRSVGRPVGRPADALSFQLKDRIQAIKRNVNRSSADRLIGSSRSLSRETYVDLFQFLLISRYVARVSANPSKLLAIYPFFCFLLTCSLLVFSPSVTFSSFLSLPLFLSHSHSHSNLFERIIHARVILEMHSREEGSAAIHRVRHSLYFIFCYRLVFFSLAIIRRTAGAHIFCREAVRCKSQLYS